MFSKGSQQNRAKTKPTKVICNIFYFFTEITKSYRAVGSYKLSLSLSSDSSSPCVSRLGSDIGSCLSDLQGEGICFHLKKNIAPEKPMEEPCHSMRIWSNSCHPAPRGGKSGIIPAHSMLGFLRKSFPYNAVIQCRSVIMFFFSPPRCVAQLKSCC